MCPWERDNHTVPPWAITALVVAEKLRRHGYPSLTDRERMIAAFLLTPGGCPSCGANQ